MRVLVTGGAGFIGSHLVEKLVSKGFNVRVLDDLSTGRLENLSTIMDRIEFVRGDVRDPRAVSRAVRGVDIVYHLAARINVEESFEKPRLYWDVNVEGTRILLDEMEKAGVGRLVFMSSAAVYGEPKSLPVREDHPLNPMNPYGETKVEGEKLVGERVAGGAVKAVVVRLFNAYGPRQEGNPYAGVVQKFVERVSRGQPPVIFGDGLQTRDFIYVEDVADALVFLGEKIEGSIVLNLGTGVETRIIDLARLVLEIYGLNGVDPVFAPARRGDVRRSVADISRIRRLGWSPRYDLRSGLSRMIMGSGRV